MNKLVYKSHNIHSRISILAGLGLLLLSAATGKVSKPDPIALFKAVSTRLAALESVSYRYGREFRYPAENYHVKSEGNIYIDFSKNNDVAGFRYQYVDERGFTIFNNTEAFTSNAKAKTMRVTQRVKKANLEGSAALYNSLITLRNVLPAIIKDDKIPKTARDTMVNNRSYHLLEFVLENKTLNYTGTGFTATTLPLTFHHKLIVDKKSNLPVTLLQTKKGSLDLNRTDFTDINVSSAEPAEKSWYYSTYLREYKIDDAKPLSIIAAGQTAPEFELTNYSSNVKESLAQYKGKIVLLEFWIRHCGYCIEAVSTLNKMHDTFPKDKFGILALNTEATRENIGLFNARNPAKYTIMYGDNAELNKDYGVGAFPQVVLINKAGTIIYSGGLDAEKLNLLIQENI